MMENEGWTGQNDWVGWDDGVVQDKKLELAVMLMGLAQDGDSKREDDETG